MPLFGMSVVWIIILKLRNYTNIICIRSMRRKQWHLRILCFCISYMITIWLSIKRRCYMLTLCGKRTKIRRHMNLIAHWCRTLRGSNCVRAGSVRILVCYTMSLLRKKCLTKRWQFNWLGFFFSMRLPAIIRIWWGSMWAIRNYLRSILHRL